MFIFTLLDTTVFFHVTITLQSTQVYDFLRWNSVQHRVEVTPIFAYRYTEADQPMMTDAMRKARLESRYSKYKRVAIRVYFPDKVVVQALFQPRETGTADLAM